MAQRTVSKAVSCIGVGVHTGAVSKLTIAPAPADHGLVFVRSDRPAGENRIPASIDCVRSADRATTLANAFGASVQTSEHLLSACAGLGLDNALLTLSGAEVPILDGSALGFCNLILSAGFSVQERPRRVLRVLDKIHVQSGPAFASLEPWDGDELHLDGEIDFPCNVIGRQALCATITSQTYLDQLAFARTFANVAELDALKSRGLSHGGSLDNAILVDGDTVVNPGGLRACDEFIRHKLLDALGDLTLAGYPIAGRYKAYRCGHALNLSLVNALRSTPSSWRIEVVEARSAAIAAPAA